MTNAIATLLALTVMAPHQGLSWTCSDPDVLRYRGVSGFWVYTQHDRDACAALVDEDYTWAQCLDATATYFPCMVHTYETEDQSFEIYRCPGLSPGTRAHPQRYRDLPPGPVDLWVGVHGVCGTAGNMFPFRVDWPALCNLDVQTAEECDW